MSKAAVSEAQRVLQQHRRVHGFPPSTFATTTSVYVPSEVHDRGWGGVPPSDTKPQSLFRVADELLKSTSPQRVLLVLGETGFGKTSFALNYLVQHEKNGNGARQPMALVALDHPPAVEMLAAVDAQLRESTVVVLDGLDEDPRARGEGSTRRRLLELWQRCSAFQRLIVTCRPDCLSIPEDLPPEWLGPPDGAGSPWVRVVDLLPFTPRQTTKVVKSLFPPMSGKRRAAQALTSAAPVVATHPLLLARLPELIDSKQSVASAADAFRAIMAAWCQREKSWIEGRALETLARSLALRATKNALEGRSERITTIELEPMTRESGLPWPLPFGPRSLVVYDADGNAVFAHHSILEHCFASALLGMSGAERRAWLGGHTLRWTPQMKAAALGSLRSGADLSGVDLGGQDLSSLDLHHANLSGASLEGCNLSHTRLFEANLTETHLEGANLQHACLRGADLSRALLAGADLTLADLCRANLAGTDLREVNIANANFRGAALCEAYLPASVLTELAPEGVQLHGSVLVEPTTGMRLLWVPGGRFRMGNDGEIEESPAHWVRVSSCWIGETPVTNRQYTRFVAETGYRQPEHWSDSRFTDPEQPVVGVSFEDALSFCRWLSEASGFETTLPTEAEWEYVARGIDGRIYPWGLDPPSSSRASFGLDAMSGGPTPVGACTQGRGPFGSLDQAGNVWEWCLDTWDKLAYVKQAGDEPTDPQVIDGDSSVRVVRGGSWFFPAEDLRACARGRNDATSRADDLGFRVVVKARFWPQASIPPAIRLEE